ncbi:MAG: hypothetical protein KAZ26_23555 [Caldilineaceae bacterium]|nr:hypothetical protein [Caldilineaceae bacterium]
MTDTITYTPTNTVAATGQPAAGTRWQWQRRTVGSIFSSQETFETWPEAEEVAQQIAALTPSAVFVVSGSEKIRRDNIGLMCDADNYTAAAIDPNRFNSALFRDTITIGEVESGQKFPSFSECMSRLGTLEF